MMEFRERAAETMVGIQTAICEGIETLEREPFVSDAWERAGGGGGLTRVLLGEVIEKGGVNTSRVFGRFSEEFASRIPGSGTEFFATGVSLVLHPQNPHVPAAHANFRYIEHGDKSWFGGGADLTPCYLHAEDKAHFHGVWQRTCAEFDDVTDYDEWRAWCDRYFYLPHRGERRGVGGIFFDQLLVSEEDPKRRDRVLEFVTRAGHAFLDAYLPIVQLRRGTPATAEQRRWQELRRGRYVEFNLLYDRGTSFGLRTGGRTESILMSLPPRVRWGYCEEPERGSPEAALLAELRGS